jgi:hypothetical protein
MIKIKILRGKGKSPYYSLLIKKNKPNNEVR